MINAVNRQIREMRRPSGENGFQEGDKVLARTGFALSHRSGDAAPIGRFTRDRRISGRFNRHKRKPFIEGQGEKIHLRLEGQAHPTYYDRYLDHSILSMPHYPPHYPHLVAARRELENWLFFYFEPRERMRAANRSGKCIIWD